MTKKIIMQSTLSVIPLADGASSRAVIEETSPGKWVAHAVISPVDIGAYPSEETAARAIRDALDRIASNLYIAYDPTASAGGVGIAEQVRDATDALTDKERAALARFRRTEPTVIDPTRTGATNIAPTTAPYVAPADTAPPNVTTAVAPSNVVAAHTSMSVDVRPGEPGAAVVVDQGHAPVAPVARMNALGHAIE